MLTEVTLRLWRSFSIICFRKLDRGMLSVRLDAFVVDASIFDLVVEEVAVDEVGVVGLDLLPEGFEPVLGVLLPLFEPPDAAAVDGFGGLV